MKYVGYICIALVLIVIIAAPIYFTCTPSGKAAWNNWFHAVQEADDETNYETKKEVENTCRAMIASYNSDKLIYEQYKDSENEEKQSWGEQARIRANNTASTYNNYILQNKYIWKDNVPNDICFELNIIV